MVAVMGVFAILAALERREQTGEGDVIDLSQIEVLTTFMAGALVQAQVTGEDPPRRDALRPGLCPHGLFPCAEPGQHVAVAVRGDEDWARLCAAIERPDLAADASLATVAGREVSRARVDDAVAAWTSERAGLAAEAALQAAGVPAALAARPGSWPPTSSSGRAASTASWTGPRSAPTRTRARSSACTPRRPSSTARHRCTASTRPRCCASCSASTTTRSPRCTTPG